MKIENLEIQFNTQNVAQLQMSRLQKDYFEVLQQERRISSTVRFYYKQGWLVHFSDLYSLIYNLTQYRIILNPEFMEYFKKLTIRQESKKYHLVEPSTPKELELTEIKNLPFFRSLKSEVRDFLLKNARIYSYPTYTLLIQQNDLDRDMYILLEGQASIYKKTKQGERYCIASLVPGCLFGEYGFFLNEPRLADVIATSPVRVLKIPYLPEIFDPWIKKQVAESLKHRFWIIHGILNSTVLSLLPEDTVDQLIHRGIVKEVKANQILFKENTPGTQFYVVIQGSIQIQKNLKNLNIMKQGDCFGELALFTNQGIRTATAITKTDGLLLEINASDFFDLLADNLFLAKEIEAIAYQRIRNDQKHKNS